MASTPVEIQAPSGRTLTLELYPLGSDTIANTGGDILTEHTNRKGFYQATVTESLSGWHHVLVKDGSTPILVGYIYLTDTTSVHRPEAPPWSVLEGRVTVEVDLIDAPNAAAITAIQNGLATASALATVDGKIDGIKAVTDALPDGGALTSLATATALQAVDDNVDAIKAVTDNLPDGGALTSLATASALATVDNVVDAILEDTSTTLPSSLTGIENKIDTVDSVADGIKAVTDKLDNLIEDSSGYRFTEKALEEAPTGGSGGATAQEVWEYATRTLTALDENSTTIDLDGAIQAATVGLDAKLDIIDGNVDAIKAVTDNLPDSGALTSLATALQTVDDNVDAILEDTGTTLPSSLSTISGKVDTANGHLTDIKGGGFNGSTDSLEAIRDRGDAAWTTADVSGLAAKTDLPANFADLSITATTGRVEIETNHDKTGYALTSDYDAAKTAAQAGDAMTLTSGTLSDIGNAAEAAAAAALADYDPPTKTQLDAAVAPLATSVELAAVEGKIDTIDGVADAILAAVGTDGVVLTSATMQAIADALLDRANAIDGATPRAALRYIAAVLAGKVTGAGTGIETFYGLNGTTPRVEVTVDSDGNRSSVEYDP